MEYSYNLMESGNKLVIINNFTKLKHNNMIKYVISFRNKTYQQLIAAYYKLKERYKGLVVSYKPKLVGTLYSGTFSVMCK